MTAEAAAIVYGLSSALAWGSGDFSGGIASRRNSVFVVLMISQFVGAVCLLGLAFAFGEQLPDMRRALFGAGAGLGGALGMTALYKGLAVGRMGVVAPLTAVLSAMLSIIFAVTVEGLPAVSTMIGIGIALVAVWILTSSPGASRPNMQEVLYSFAAGAGIALFFILIDQVGSTDIIWPLFFARTASIVLFLAVCAVRLRKASLKPAGLPVICGAGILDTAGNALFVLAAGVGRLDIAVVLASLSPAVTVILACILLKERLTRRQWTGVAAAMVALVLISW